jgi:hypothetical protein
MFEPVGGGDAELRRLLLGGVEGFEDGEIAVEINGNYKYRKFRAPQT